MSQERAAAIRALRAFDSQETFAQKLGLARVTVVQLEKGSEPSLDTARRLVDAGLDPKHVLAQAGLDHGRSVS